MPVRWLRNPCGWPDTRGHPVKLSSGFGRGGRSLTGNPGTKTEEQLFAARRRRYNLMNLVRVGLVATAVVVTAQTESRFLFLFSCGIEIVAVVHFILAAYVLDEAVLEGRPAYVASALDELATHDPLTGLPNRRALEGRAEEELGRAARYRRRPCPLPG